MIDQGIILAAGFGRRLRPITDRTPKPLVNVHGAPIIEPVITMMEEAGVQHIAVNTHYKAAMIEDYLTARDNKAVVQISHEDTILDTGGGLKKAYSLLAEAPFFVMSGDSIVLSGPAGNPLKAMAEKWDPATMDIMILLIPVTQMTLTKGVGDYDLDDDSTPVRRPDKSGAYMWTSVRLCHPRIFEDTPDEPFSFLPLLDKAEKAGRLAAMVHDGRWLHITTPADLERVNAAARDVSAMTAQKSDDSGAVKA